MKAIAAADRNWAIGNKGSLLCHIPGDLKYFKEKTIGKTVVMGRKTLESLPGGRPLPGMQTIVLSRSLEAGEGFTVCRSVEEVIEACKDKDTFICGGEEIYREFEPYCDTLYITRINEEFEADAYFPEPGEDMEIVWQSEVFCEKGHEYQFLEYRRKK